MDEEEILKRISKLLEQGCTMLAQHHDCGAPLFRCKGKILCPVCSLEAEARREMQSNDAELAASNSAIAFNGADEKDYDRNGDRDYGGNYDEGREKERPSSAMPIISQVKEREDSIRSKLEGLDKRSIISDQFPEGSAIINKSELIVSLRKNLIYKTKELSDNIVREQELSRLQAMLECIEVALRILTILNEDI